ncbi:MAG: hypothetical protein AB2A00_28370 [Myxococcota bacterium]
MRRVGGCTGLGLALVLVTSCGTGGAEGEGAGSSSGERIPAVRRKAAPARPGVRGDEEIENMAGVTSFRAMKAAIRSEFVAYPMGILGHVLLQARHAMSFQVFDPPTGNVVDERTPSAGEQLDLTGGEAFLIKGVFTEREASV